MIGTRGTPWFGVAATSSGGRARWCASSRLSTGRNMCSGRVEGSRGGQTDRRRPWGFTANACPTHSPSAARGQEMGSTEGRRLVVIALSCSDGTPRPSEHAEQRDLVVLVGSHAGLFDVGRRCWKVGGLDPQRAPLGTNRTAGKLSSGTPSPGASFRPRGIFGSERAGTRTCAVGDESMSRRLDAVCTALAALEAVVAELRVAVDALQRRRVSAVEGVPEARRAEPSALDRKRAGAALRRQGLEPVKVGGRP